MINIEIHLNGHKLQPAAWCGRLLRRRRVLLTVGLVLASLPVAAIAAPISTPNTFTAGTVISAADVNANFTSVVDGVNANDTAIAVLDTEVADHETRLGTLETSAIGGCVWEEQAAQGLPIAIAVCPAGRFALTGGCTQSGATTLERSYAAPLPNDGDPPTATTQWVCDYSSTAGIKTAYALCCN